MKADLQINQMLSSYSLPNDQEMLTVSLNVGRCGAAALWNRGLRLLSSSADALSLSFACKQMIEREKNEHHAGRAERRR